MYEMHREVSTSAKTLGKPTEVQTEDFPLQCQYLECIHFVGGVVQRSYKVGQEVSPLDFRSDAQD